MTKLIAACILALALSGCGGGPDATEACFNGHGTADPEWNQCIAAHNARMAAPSDAAGMALLGFANGYNQAWATAPVFVSCTHTGIMTNCIGQ